MQGEKYVKGVFPLMKLKLLSTNLKSRGGGETISWEDFLKNKGCFHSKTIVIGSIIYYEEIKKTITDSNYFLEEQILYIDDWIEKFSPRYSVLNEQIKLSIVVPVYNVENYIRDCIESLINQTYQNIEIILVDDGSTDGSGEICDEYSKKDQRVIVVHKTNGGLVSARKVGIRMATAEYATYVDSDDWIDINAYEELMKFSIEYHPDIIAYDFIKEYLDFNMERIQPLKKGFYNKELFLSEFEKCVRDKEFFCQGVHFTSWSKIFKTELLKKHQLDLDEEIHIGEDAAVVFPCILDMKSIYIVKQSFYHYRVRENSITRSREVDEYHRYLKIAEVLNVANAKVESKVWKDKITHYLIFILYYYLILCAPEYCFKKDKHFFLFPKVEKSDRIIIYGKGVFADGITKYIEKTNFCTIIDHLDRTDVDRVRRIPKESFNFIVIAITDFAAVSLSRSLLERMGVNRNKILSIQKEDLIEENLPTEVKSILDCE